jgi:hypothetical protein
MMLFVGKCILDAGKEGIIDNCMVLSTFQSCNKIKTAL